MPDGTPQGPEGDRIETTVRAVLATMAGDLTAKESVLLAEHRACQGRNRRPQGRRYPRRAYPLGH
jgi:hypothetical protein